MNFGAGQTVTRLRAQKATDPYSKREIGKDWSNPDRTLMQGVWVSARSSTPGSDATRQQVTTSKSLYGAPGLDIRVGDRIDTGADVYQVVAVPAADTNPWTSWQPVQEVPLELVEG